MRIIMRRIARLVIPPLVAFVGMNFSFVSADDFFARSRIVVVNDVIQSQEITPFGDGTVFSVTFRTLEGNQRVLIDVELADENGRRIARRMVDSVFVGESGSSPLVFVAPAGLPAGRYALNIGIFTPHGKKVLAWYDRTATLTIAHF